MGHRYAGVAMLRFTPIENARHAETYYSKSDGGYYLDDHDLHREWGGKGAAMLGLSGPPDYEHFRRLIHGLDPHTGEQLTAKLIDDRIPGWDVTASLPKGVTAALELGDERIRELLWRAGRQAMADLEELATTRVRKGGRQEDRVTNNLLWYAKEDPETRPTKDDGMPDWDRHIHFVVFNLTRDEAEGEWKAVKFRPIMDLRKFFSHRFDMYMSHGLAEQGYEIETKTRSDGKGGKRYFSWDIRGIPESVISNSSRRTKEVDAAEEKALAALQKKIEEKNREEGTSEPIPEELSIRARDKLGATSRLHKRDDLTLADYREYWNSRITPEEGQAIAETIRRARQGQNTKPENTADKGAAFATGHWFHRHGVLEQRRRQVTGLFITAMEKCMGGALPQDLAREFQKQGVFANDDALPVWDVRKELTTEATYRQERSITGFTRGGRGKLRPVVADAREVRRLLRQVREDRQSDITLSDQQERAVIGLLGSRDVVNVVDAGQGTGKTEMLGQFGEILGRRRVASTWLGTTHTAVGELSKLGLPAMTVAHFLKSQKEQQKAAGSRLIVDESSMLAQADAYRLCQYAKEHGCRIDFVGDSKQYKSPVAGDTMRLLTSRYTGIVPITMTRTMRQEGKLKEAMEAIRDGRVLDGHDMLSGLGMVHEMPLGELARRAADLYLEWTAKGDQVPVISPTHAQADEIAAMIRQGLRARGDLTGEDRTVRRLVRLDWSPPQIEEAREQGAEGVVFTPYGAFLDQTQVLAAGDRVRTTMGGATKDGGHRLCNGTRYRIKGFTRAGDPVLNNGWVVDRNWGGLVQDYVSTGQGSQGKTANRAVVVYGTPSLVATRQEGFYVPVSRVRREVAVLTDSNAELREAIQKQESRKFATEVVEARLRRRLPLRQRLGKHLAYVRRLAAFAAMHQRGPRETDRTQTLHRERDYGR
jgi:conjugative relaxase-like TrwC/TraI family protein